MENNQSGKRFERSTLYNSIYDRNVHKLTKKIQHGIIMTKVSKNQSIVHGRPGVEGHYYQFPEINGGTTVAFATFTGEHGERTIGERARIYYILKGRAKFKVNKETFEAVECDTIAIPSHGTYNLWPITDSVEVLLVMEFLDFDKLPK